ncbi:MAG: hypothetical protein JWO66_142 [Candidatus Eremiobacteraeota bacterium]|nr:hypothetical protein [Candidatus Eremiobacteraeota bacterium]
MNDIDISEQALFDRALLAIPAGTAPVDAIRRRTQARRRTERALRFGGTIIFAAVAVFVATTWSTRNTVLAAGIAFVERVLSPVHPVRAIVLDKQGVRTDYARVVSLADAQNRLPFRVRAPALSSGWTLQTVLVADASHGTALALLYRTPGGSWVKIVERPATAASQPVDTDVTALLTSAGAPQRTINGVLVTTGRVRSQTISRSYLLGDARTTIAASGPDAATATQISLYPLR